MRASTVYRFTKSLVRSWTLLRASCLRAPWKSSATDCARSILSRESMFVLNQELWYHHSFSTR